MEKILINITLSMANVPDLESLLPQELAMGQAWKQQGIMEQLLAKADDSGVFLLLHVTNENHAKTLVSELPLYPYFDNVVYTMLK